MSGFHTFFSRNDRGMAIGLLIISIALAGVGIAFVSVAQHVGSLEDFAKTWKTAPGTITRAAVESPDKNPFPSVNYKFSADQKTFEGNRIFFSEGPYRDIEEKDGKIHFVVSSADETPEAMTLAVGQTVTVHYNPAHPQDSVLYPRVLKQMRGFLFLGIGAVVLAMFFGVRSFAYD